VPSAPPNHAAIAASTMHTKPQNEAPAVAFADRSAAIFASSLLRRMSSRTRSIRARACASSMPGWVASTATERS
jgi:hypothetical protein